MYFCKMLQYSSVFAVINPCLSKASLLETHGHIKCYSAITRNVVHLTRLEGKLQDCSLISVITNLILS